MTNNLNEQATFETDFDNIKPKLKDLKDFSLSLGFQGKTMVVFRNFAEKLITQINKSEVVVGCVAWLTHEGILNALANPEHGVSIILQKEDFLRPDVDEKPDWAKTLQLAYSKLRPCEYQASGGWLETIESQPSESFLPDISIRCIGECNNQDRIIPRMHHKFLVFCKLEGQAPDRKIIVPYAVWTGSFNMTKNATKSFENAVLIFDKRIAQAYYNEWRQLILLSEKLDWSSPVVRPDVRFNTGEYFT